MNKFPVYHKISIFYNNNKQLLNDSFILVLLKLIAFPNEVPKIIYHKKKKYKTKTKSLLSSTKIKKRKSRHSHLSISNAHTKLHSPPVASSDTKKTHRITTKCITLIAKCLSKLRGKN